jgi:tRNA threonylcarbamoyladenosine biosynthesis protein TsaB
VKILALDTATENCSAALWIDGACQERLQETPREHAHLILGMVDGLMAEAGLKLTQLDAIAFGRGPGSFTGVRLAVAVTQGLAFAADLPVLPVSNLRALARQAFAAAPTAVLAVCCADARMGEVYHAEFGRELECLGSEQVLPPGSVPTAAPLNLAAVAIGRGFAVYPSLLTLAGRSWEARLERALPRAQDIAALGVEDLQRGKAVSPVEALPVYLRNNVVTRP